VQDYADANRPVIEAMITGIPLTDSARQKKPSDLTRSRATGALLRTGRHMTKHRSTHKIVFSSEL
jgi:hypothetical protein